MTESRKYVVALFQGTARHGDPSSNLLKMKEETLKAGSIGADLIVFPELFLSGYRLKEDEVKRVAEENNGCSFQELSALAKEKAIGIVYGYPEIDRSSGDIKYYNSAQLIGKDGTSLLNYHKSHLWLGDGYESLYTPGDDFPVADFCSIKVGLLICYDVEFPEPVRALAMKGAQFVAVPSAGYGNAYKHMIPCRAMENGLYVAYVNHTKGVYCGHTKCCDPNGSIVVEAGTEETMLLATIDPKFKTQWSYLDDRKPLLYKDIVNSK